MEPVRMIVTALTLGAAASHKETSRQIVKDAHIALKDLIRRKYAHVDLAALEASPENKNHQAVVEEELQKAGADRDNEIIQQAHFVLSTIHDAVPNTAVATEKTDGDNQDILLPSTPITGTPIFTFAAPVKQVGPRTIITGGGNYIEGDFYEAESAFDVRGQPSPYLGLAAYTYDHQHSYAGRSTKIAHTVSLLTRPGNRRNLLFITGASGSGKSSFVQAGLIPALERHYNQIGSPVHRAVMRPFKEPLKALGEALHGLGLPADGPFSSVRECTLPIPFQPALPKQISLLVIDQFEEFFTQSLMADRASFFSILTALPSYAHLPLHVIITLRSDYLGDLFSYPDLYTVAKQGVELYAMTESELKDAIQQPIHHFNKENNTHFRMEDGLLRELARDAAQDPSYLPLLQVTCDDIWRRGWLKREAYGDITDAIHSRAEEVFELRNATDVNPTVRTKDEQKEILSIFVDLIDVSTTNENRRDARRRRLLEEVTRGDLQRRRLVDELTAQRLLSTNQETDSQTETITVTVDIIHDSLIDKWDRLKLAIETQREHLQQRARFETALQEWKCRKGKKEAVDYLLTGVRLAEAKDLDKKNNVALQSKEANGFLQESIKRQERRQHITLGGVILLAASVITALIVWGFQVDDLNQSLAIEVTRSFNAEKTAGAESAQKIAAAATAEERRIEAEFQAHLAATREAEALHAQNFAERQFRRAVAEQLAIAARNEISENNASNDLALLLAREAATTIWNTDGYLTPNVEWVLRQAIQTSYINKVLPLNGHHNAVTSVGISADGTIVVSASRTERTALIWDAKNGKTLHRLDHSHSVNAVAISPNNTFVVTGSDDPPLRIWDVTTGNELQQLRGHTAAVTALAFSHDGKWLISGSQDLTVRIWDFETGNELLRLHGHTDTVVSVSLNHDSSRLVSGSNDKTVRVWDTVTGTQIRSMEASSSIDFVTVTPGGYILALGQHYFRTWDEETEEEIPDFIPIGRGLAVAQDGEHIVYADRWTIKMFDLKTKKESIFGDHYGGITSLSLNANGTLLVSGGAMGGVRIWDTVTFTELHRLSDDPGGFNTAVFSPNGSRIYAGGQDGTVHIWNTKTGDTVGQLDFASGVSSVVISPDGTRAFIAVYDSVHVWDTNHGTQLFRIAGHDGEIKTLAITPDGKKLISGSRNVLIISDAENGIELGRIAYTSSPIALAGNRIIIGSSAVNAHDLETGNFLQSFSYFTEKINAVSANLDGSRIVAAADTVVYVWDGQSGALLHRLEDPPLLLGYSQHSITSVAINSSGTLVVSGGQDGIIRMWETSSGLTLHRLEGHSGRITSITFSPDGNQLISSSIDGTVRVWNTNSYLETNLPLEVHRIEGHTQTVTSVAISPDEQRVVSASEDGTICIWDTTTGQQLHLIQADQHGVYALAIHPDGQRLVSGGFDKTVRIWDMNTGSQLHELKGHTSFVSTLAISPDGTMIASGSSSSSNDSVHIWDMESGTLIRRFDSHDYGASGLDFSPDNLHLAIVTSNDFISGIWNVENAVEIGRLQGFSDLAYAVDIDANGSQIASAALDGVHLWSMADKTKIRDFKGHRGSVSAVTFNADGSRIISGAIDNTIRIWNTSDETEIGVLQGHTAPVTSIAIGSTNRYIVSGSEDHTVRVWATNIDHLLAAIDMQIQRPSHSFTEEEKQQLGLEGG